MLRKIIVIFSFTSILVAGGAFLFTASAANSRLNKAQTIWQEQQINSYEIQVRYIESIWSDQTYTITVRNGRVADATVSCTPAPFEGDTCQLHAFDPHKYTVDGLFETAATYQSHEYAKTEYDATYGYPHSIYFDDPEIYDEDVSWYVLSFKPLGINN